MKTFYVIPFIALMILASCNNNAQDESISEVDTIQQKGGSLFPDYEKLPEELCNAKIEAFNDRSYNNLQNYLVNKEFNISRALFDSMSNGFPSGKNILRLYFVQFKKTDFPGKYTTLAPFDGKLYVVYGYANLTEDSPETYYASFDLQNTIEFSQADFDIMHNAYKTNIKPAIDSFTIKGNNTNYIKITKQEFEDYQHKLASSKENITNLKFILAEVINPNEVNPPIDLGNIVYNFSETQGQLTFITNAYSSGGLEESLSFYDANSLCPEICP